MRRAKLPALLLCGEGDMLCPLGRHRLMHELIAGSSLVTIARSGHLPTLEQPEPTNMALKRWLEST
ncbi:alpha/beta fold hydrolase [Manganibacter manganicus]|uniref:alpha/beta fold hydrolase n=1 Tax=Manganibacter manganicus TaxID=1873176 RepID=UPI003CC9F590